jgi:hypothetical protein
VALLLLLLQAVPCTSPDHIYCRVLGMHAVDAAFAGYTGACRVGLYRSACICDESFSLVQQMPCTAAGAQLEQLPAHSRIIIRLA